MAKPLPALFALIAFLAPAQTVAFRNLATTDDGSVLYFATGVYLKGSTPDGSAKIFRWAGGKLERVPFPARSLSVFAGLQVSGDGQLLAISTYSCSLFFCDGTRGETLLRSAAGDRVIPALATISRNGRYAAGEIDGAATLIDLTTGTRTALDTGRPASDWTGYRPTDDGRVLLLPASDVPLSLWSPSGVRALSAPSTPTAIIDASGSVVLYEHSRSPGEFAFTTLDLRTSTEWTLGAIPWFAPVANPFGWFRDSFAGMSLSDDGSRATFLNQTGSVAQLFLGDPATGAVQRLTDDRVGIADAVLSGDGRIAYAETAWSRLLRVDTQTGLAQEIVPATPYSFLMIVSTEAPGSLIEPARLLVTDVGRGVLLDDNPLPRIDDRYFQIPWDAREGRHTIRAASDSPFEDMPGVLMVASVSPQFLAVLHADWSGPVTASQPAHAGETVLAYMTGLGPVEQPQATGVPAPVDTLVRVTSRSFDCRVEYPSAQFLADVQFAGLAPGLIGVYQVNVKLPNVLPETPRAADIRLECGVSSARDSIPLFIH